MTTEQIIAILTRTASLAHSLAIGITPHQKAVRRGLDDTQPGDVVLEITTIGGRHEDGSPADAHRLGILRRVAQEPLCEEDGEVYGHETAWHIELPDGREFRWVNAQFIRLPDSFQALRVMEDRAELLRAARRCADCGATWPGRDIPYPDWTQFDGETRQCRNCHAGRPVKG